MVWDVTYVAQGHLAAVSCALRLDLARNCMASTAGCSLSCIPDATTIICVYETDLKTSLCSDRGGWCGAALFHSGVSVGRRCPKPQDYHRLYRRGRPRHGVEPG